MLEFDFASNVDDEPKCVIVDSRSDEFRVPSVHERRSPLWRQYERKYKSKGYQGLPCGKADALGCCRVSLLNTPNPFASHCVEPYSSSPTQLVFPEHSVQ